MVRIVWTVWVELDGLWKGEWFGFGLGQYGSWLKRLCCVGTTRCFAVAAGKPIHNPPRWLVNIMYR